MVGVAGVTGPAESAELSVSAAVAVLEPESVAVTVFAPVLAPDGTVKVPWNDPYEFVTKVPEVQLPIEAVRHVALVEPTAKLVTDRPEPYP
jgi:hypothetical protein